MVFIDSGAWIALTDRKDQYHKKAALIYNNLKERRELLTTTDYIIDETVTRLRYDLGHATAVRFLALGRVGILPRNLIWMFISKWILSQNKSEQKFLKSRGKLDLRWIE